MSTTSVLILSGFLIGVAVGHGGAGELSPYVLACGLAGMLAFVGFDLARTRRRERALLNEYVALASRLERHLLPSQSSAAGTGESEPSLAGVGATDGAD